MSPAQAKPRPWRTIIPTGTTTKTGTGTTTRMGTGITTTPM